MTITYKEKEYTREDIQDMIKYGYNELVVRLGWYLLSMLDKKKEDKILGVVDNDKELNPIANNECSFCHNKAIELEQEVPICKEHKLGDY